MRMLAPSGLSSAMNGVLAKAWRTPRAIPDQFEHILVAVVIRVAEMGLAISPGTAGVFGGNYCLFSSCGQDGKIRPNGNCGGFLLASVAPIWHRYRHQNKRSRA